MTEYCSKKVLSIILQLACGPLFQILYFHVTSLPFYLCRWWSNANDKVKTVEVVYDHVGKCRELALCYFIQINFILFDHHAFGNRKFQAKSHVTNPLQTCYRVSRKIVTEIASHFKICATEYRKCHFSGLKLNIFIAIYCKLPIWICTKTNTRTDTRDT